MSLLEEFDHLAKLYSRMSTTGPCAKVVFVLLGHIESLLEESPYVRAREREREPVNNLQVWKVNSRGILLEVSFSCSVVDVARTSRCHFKDDHIRRVESIFIVCMFLFSACTSTFRRPYCHKTQTSQLSYLHPE